MISSTKHDFFIKNYKLLEELNVIDLINNNKKHSKSQIQGYMDLNFDIITNSESIATFALSQYYKDDSGDMIPDPDLMIRAFLEKRLVEVISLQNKFGIVFVYDESDKLLDPNEKRELNQYLEKYLLSILKNGHIFASSTIKNS